MTLSDRLKKARKNSGLTQKELAKAIRAGQSLIGMLETGERKESAKIPEIAEVLGVSALWLATGRESKLPPIVIENAKLLTSDSRAGYNNTRAGPEVKGFVPRISSVQAGHWSEIEESFTEHDALEWLPCPVPHGPRTFCLVVEGESMRNLGAKPSYDPGDVIFVDPDVGPCTGDRVVVSLESQTSATFKQYCEEDGRKLLKALNPDWKPRYIEINGDATVVGVVIGKWVSE